jgi:hypothetical protein
MQDEVKGAQDAFALAKAQERRRNEVLIEVVEGIASECEVCGEPVFGGGVVVPIGALLHDEGCLAEFLHNHRRYETRSWWELDDFREVCGSPRWVCFEYKHNVRQPESGQRFLIDPKTGQRASLADQSTWGRLGDAFAYAWQAFPNVRPRGQMLLVDRYFNLVNPLSGRR